jgi:hypothetical protein
LSNMASNYTRNQGCGVMMIWTQGVAGFHERTNKELAIFWAVIWCFFEFFWEPWLYKNWVLFVPILIYQNPTFECLWQWWLSTRITWTETWWVFDTVFDTHPTLENTNWWLFLSSAHTNNFRAHFVRVTVMSSKNRLDNQRRSFPVSNNRPTLQNYFHPSQAA